jgi:hypothetical protein
MRKQMLIQQKASYEQTLKERLAVLAKKDKAPKPDKDTIVRQLKADIRTIGRRLAAITAIEKKTEELAKMKADKAAAPKQEAPKAEKSKKGGDEPKAKKPKAEKPAKPKAEGPKEEAAPKEKPEPKA